MDADVVEIPPLFHLLRQQKHGILHDVIDIDDDVDSENLVIIDEKVGKSNKGKTIEAIHEVVEVSDYTFCQPDVENFGVVSGIESSNTYPLAILHDVNDIVDDVDSDHLVIIGEKVSKSNKGKTVEAVHQVVEVSDHTFCQPGMENFGPVSRIESSNGYPLVSHNLVNVDGHGSDLSYDDDDHIDIFSEDYADGDEYALLQAHLDNVDIPLGTEAPFTLLPEYDLGLKKSTFENRPWYDMQSDAKNSQVTDSSQPSWSLEPSISEVQGSIIGSSNLQIKMDNVDQVSGTELSSQLFSQAAPRKKKSSASPRSGLDLNIPLGVQSSKSKRFLKSFHHQMKSASFGSKNRGLAGNSEARKLLHPGKSPVAAKFKSAKKAFGNSSSYHESSKVKTLGKFPSFKQFDNVNDASDHHFKNSSMKQIQYLFEFMNQGWIS